MTERPEDPEDDHIVVRPYLLTGGRTQASLPIETVVTAARALGATAGVLPGEHRAIVDLCVTPSAIAEVSAHLRLPLGVARVLVADLVDHGWLTASQTAGDHPEIDLVERLISGLRALA